MNRPTLATITLLGARRRRLGLKEADLAARCSMRLDQLRRFERGQFLPSPLQAYLLAQALKLDPDAFCRWVILRLLLYPEYLAEHVNSLAVS